MAQKPYDVKTVDWQESWRPAFRRLVASIAAVERLTGPA
jgi:hypothetical protein